MDGAAACVLPALIVRQGWWLNGVLGVWLIWMMTKLIYIRVGDEEAMLKDAFGEEWEEYHRKTKRFIPGVF